MIYGFGRFTLDTDRHELAEDSAAVKVEPQVFAVLRHLIEHRDRVVSKDELIEAVWQGRIVSDATLDSRINAVRRAVGDSGKAQAIIKTVPKRGFRFVADIAPTGANVVRGGTPHLRQSVRFCASADGTRIAFAELGSGVPLVRAGTWLTHLELDWNGPIWRPVIEALGAHFKVVRHDQRGNGLSDRDVDDFTLDRFVEDLEAVVDAAELDRFTLFGHSQGAPISIAYAVRHPERVERLVLLGGFAEGRLRRASSEERENAKALLTLMKRGWGQEGSPFLQAFGSIFLPDGSNEQLQWLVELQRSSTNVENAIRLREAFDTIDIRSHLSRVSVPTLVLHCREDAVHPLDQGRMLASSIPNATLVVMEGRNHILTPPDPAWNEFLTELLGFVGGQSGVAR